MKKKPLIALLFIVAVLLSIRGYLKISKLDRSGPVISYSNDLITYKQGDSYATVLKDVKAIDKNDGDVTNELIVEKIDADEEAKQAIVTYAAIDSHMNLSKVSRIVQFIPKQKEDNKETAQPKPTPAGSASKEEAPKTTGALSATPMVLDKSPVMFLKTDKITIGENDKFTIRNFIARIIDDKDDEKVLLNNLKKEGSYNCAKKGDYELILYVVDSEGNESNREKVILSVK